MSMFPTVIPGRAVRLSLPQVQYGPEAITLIAAVIKISDMTSDIDITAIPITAAYHAFIVMYFQLSENQPRLIFSPISSVITSIRIENWGIFIIIFIFEVAIIYPFLNQSQHVVEPIGIGQFLGDFLVFSA